MLVPTFVLLLSTFVFHTFIFYTFITVLEQTIYNLKTNWEEKSVLVNKN